MASTTGASRRGLSYRQATATVCRILTGGIGHAIRAKDGRGHAALTPHSDHHGRKAAYRSPPTTAMASSVVAGRPDSDYVLIAASWPGLAPDAQRAKALLPDSHSQPSPSVAMRWSTVSGWQARVEPHKREASRYGRLGSRYTVRAAIAIKLIRKGSQNYVRPSLQGLPGRPLLHLQGHGSVCGNELYRVQGPGRPGVRPSSLAPDRPIYLRTRVWSSVAPGQREATPAAGDRRSSSASARPHQYERRPTSRAAHRRNVKHEVTYTTRSRRTDRSEGSVKGS